MKINQWRWEYYYSQVATKEQKAIYSRYIRSLTGSDLVLHLYFKFIEFTKKIYLIKKRKYVKKNTRNPNKFLALEIYNDKHTFVLELTIF